MLRAGIEGVVVKNVKHAYRPARRSWQKIKTRVTAEAVVGGVIGPLDAPEMGCCDDVREGGRRVRLTHQASRMSQPARVPILLMSGGVDSAGRCVIVSMGALPCHP
jgi:hypothetical protein